jgi:hypothetical protein
MNSPERVKEGAGFEFAGRGFLRELLLTLAAAIWTGLTGSMLLILLVFLLTGPGQ